MVGSATVIKQVGGLIQLKLKKGATVILYTGNKPKSFEINPIAIKASDRNFWGVK